MAPKKYENTAITFDVYPKIVQSHRKSTITIKPVFARPLTENSTYRITLAPMEYDSYDRTKRQTQIVSCRSGALSCEFLFEKEQEYRLLLSEDGDEKTDTLGVFHLYCIDEDLSRFRPFKGDFHLHSFYSDGRNNPGFLASSCRKEGLDFMTVTDHREYSPSIEAQNDFASMDIDLAIFRGEEIHPPRTETHMIGFGAKETVKKHFADEGEYIRRIEQKMRDLSDQTEDLDEEQEKYEYASCRFIIDRVREAGGMCFFAHPYWATGNRYNVSTPLAEKFLKENCFDAFELFNGDYLDINTLQLALYHELNQRQKIPLVSGTDAHGIIDHHFFGTFHTIVFSEDCEFSSIRRNILGLKSVVVMPVKGDAPFVYGPIRFVKYTLYLLREVLPIHDMLCREEGILMESALRGSDKAVAALSCVQGQVKEFYDRIYGG